jgi:hypothetical protein
MFCTDLHLPILRNTQEMIKRYSIDYDFKHINKFKWK